MELLSNTHPLKTVVNIDPFYLKLIMEFIVNLPKGLNDSGNNEFR